MNRAHAQRRMLRVMWVTLTVIIASMIAAWAVDFAAPPLRLGAAVAQVAVVSVMLVGQRIANRRIAKGDAKRRAATMAADAEPREPAVSPRAEN